ncbi:MAG: hypothetical protein N4A74_02045, partial [Carboxylicivirga sp.]|nr:hypothetical protein [Carboxylicivirga sp.]
MTSTSHKDKTLIRKKVTEIYINAVKSGFIPLLIAIIYTVFSDNKEAISIVLFCLFYAIISAILYLPVLVLKKEMNTRNESIRNIGIYFHLTILTLYLMISTYKYGIDYGYMSIIGIFLIIDIWTTLKVKK